MRNSNVQRPGKIKGVAWLLDNNCSSECSQGSSKEITGLLKVMQQSNKWKKNTADRFACFSKTMKKSIENRLQDQQRNFSQYTFTPLSQSESLWSPSEKKSLSHQRKSISGQMINMRKEQKDLQMQVSKVGKLKEITNIFEKKKEFYDTCIQQYFKNYEIEIDKTITKITRGPLVHPKAKVQFKS